MVLHSGDPPSGKGLVTCVPTTPGSACRDRGVGTDTKEGMAYIPWVPPLILVDGPSHPPGQSQARAGRGGGRLKRPSSHLRHSGPQEGWCEPAKDRTRQYTSTPLAWAPPLRFPGSCLKYYLLSLGVCTQRGEETESKRKEIWAGLGASFQDHNLLASHTKPTLDLSPQLSQQTGCGGGWDQRR